MACRSEKKKDFRLTEIRQIHKMSSKNDLYNIAIKLD